MGVLSTLSYWEFHKKLLPNPQTTTTSTNNNNNSNTKFALVDDTDTDADKDADADTENDTDTDADTYIPQDHRTSPRRIATGIANVIRESVPMAASLTSHTMFNNGPNQQQQHKRKHKNKHKNSNPCYTLEYSFYNWHEPTTVKGVSFHDTDVLVSTSSNTNCNANTNDNDNNNDNNNANANALVISFAGTASVADAFTNLQTFEPANHSKFFEPIINDEDDDDEDDDGKTETKSKTQGSLHRGFLNAYSRVERGSVLRLRNTNANATNPTTGHNNDHGDHDGDPRQQTQRSTKWWRRRDTPTRNTKTKAPTPTTPPPILDGLDRRFGHCQSLSRKFDSVDTDDVDTDGDDDDTKTPSDALEPDERKPKNKTKQKQKQKQKPKQNQKQTPNNNGCKITETRLSAVLTELVETALSNGYTVHVTGHSLGGALATLLVLDVLLLASATDNNKSNHAQAQKKNRRKHTHTNRRKRKPKRKRKKNKTHNHNKTNTDTNNLYLWTFGAPQIADSLFWESLLGHSPSLRFFFLGRNQSSTSSSSSFVRFRRYVTFSDDGKVDVVSEVAKNTLAAHKQQQQQQQHDLTQTQTQTHTQSHTTTHQHRNDKVAARSSSTTTTTTSEGGRPKKTSDYADLWHGKVAQSLGGVSRGGEVTHFFEAHYLWTPFQHQKQLEQQQHQHQQQHQQQQQQEQQPGVATVATDTRSSVAAHSMRNYLMGISRESSHHPLVPDVPIEWLEFLEIASPSASA